MNLVTGPDAVLVKEQLQSLQALLDARGLEFFCRFLFWILGKKPKKFATDEDDESEEGRIIVPFAWNTFQKRLYARLGRNNLVVKARQIGSTTWFLLARLLANAITRRGTGCALISQSNEYAQKHFRIALRADRLIGAVDPYRDLTGRDPNSPNVLCTSLKRNLLHKASSNRRELIYDQIDSQIMIASAEVEESGQGVTLHHILADEFARWPGKPSDTLSNVRGALVPNGTTDKACTANGASGPFHQDVLTAYSNPDLSDAVLHFFPHWIDEDSQLPLTEKEKDVLEADLNADELRLIAKMHDDLKDVAFIPELSQQRTIPIIHRVK